MGFLQWRYGFRLRGTDPAWHRTSGWNPKNLRKTGLAPATLVDVGVARGTPGLYEAFPDAYLALVDPLREFEGDMRSVVAERPGEFHLTAVGAEEGSATIHVDPERPFASSLADPARRDQAPGAAERFEHREVPVTTVDALLAAHGWQPPYGLKIDAEGFEHEVVLGAAKLLEQAQFVIAETWVTKRFEGGDGLAEFVGLMRDRDFRLCDILDGQKTEVGGDVQWLDLMFRRPRPRERSG